MLKKHIIKGAKSFSNNKFFLKSLNDFLEKEKYIINLSKYEADGEQTLKDYKIYDNSTLKYLSFEETEDLTIKWYKNYMENHLRDFRFGISLYPQGFKTKPDEQERNKINLGIASNSYFTTLDDFKDLVGNQGFPFMCGMFQNIDKKSKWIGRRKTNFVWQQVWALDFDEGITFEEFVNRAMKYNIEPHFIYKTMSCDEKQLNKFRAVWIADFVCTHTTVSESVSKLLMAVFPEADKACKDVSRIFYGGKGIIYENSFEYLERLNLLKLVNAVQEYIKDTNAKHRLEMMRNISEQTKICLRGGLFDVKLKNISKIKEYQIRKKCLYLENSGVYYNINYDITSQDYYGLFEDEVVTDNDVYYILLRKWEYGRNWYVLRINLGKLKPIENKEKSKKNPKQCYKIKSNFEYSLKLERQRGIKKEDIEKRCQLCKDLFDDKYLEFAQLLGICMNFINIEGGLTWFKESLYNSQHNIERETDWQVNSEKINKQGLYPERCIKFCPYINNCKHGKNIIETVKTKRNTVVVIDKLELLSLEQGQERLNEIVKGVFEDG